MSLAIEPLRSEHLAAAATFDSSFLVDSRLSLRARDGTISYDIVPLTPYCKHYEQIDGDDALREYLDGDEAAAFVAIDDGALIGRLLLSRNWNGLALIDDIAVDANVRRSGAGSALIDRAREWTREHGLPGLMLETQDNNVAACLFYARKGFVLGGFDRFHYANDSTLKHETALFWYLMAP